MIVIGCHQAGGCLIKRLLHIPFPGQRRSQIGRQSERSSYITHNIISGSICPEILRIIKIGSGGIDREILKVAQLYQAVSAVPDVFFKHQIVYRNRSLLSGSDTASDDLDDDFKSFACSGNLKRCAEECGLPGSIILIYGNFFTVTGRRIGKRLHGNIHSDIFAVKGIDIHRKSVCSL